MSPKALVTEGAGFIGANLTQRFLAERWQIVLLDNLSSRGADQNLQWLRSQGFLEFAKIDIRDYDPLKRLFEKRTDLGAVHGEVCDDALLHEINKQKGLAGLDHVGADVDKHLVASCRRLDDPANQGAKTSPSPRLHAFCVADKIGAGSKVLP